MASDAAQIAPKSETDAEAKGFHSNQQLLGQRSRSSACCCSLHAAKKHLHGSIRQKQESAQWSEDARG